MYDGSFLLICSRVVSIEFLLYNLLLVWLFVCDALVPYCDFALSTTFAWSEALVLLDPSHKRTV